MTLEQQLEYIYDRGYWSIVKNRTRGHYFMVSTKDEYGKLHCHGYAETKELATKYSHAFTLDNFLRGEDIENLEIVDTIHPSELMGKGFRVGDKVIAIENGIVYEVLELDDEEPNYVVGLKHDSKDRIWFYHQDLKPVLHVEENNVCMKCGVTVNSNDIGVLRTGTDYFCCYTCDKEVNKVIELLKKTKVIKDGHIVNL